MDARTVETIESSPNNLVDFRDQLRNELREGKITSETVVGASSRALARRMDELEEKQNSHYEHEESIVGRHEGAILSLFEAYESKSWLPRETVRRIDEYGNSRRLIYHRRLLSEFTDSSAEADDSENQNSWLMKAVNSEVFGYTLQTAASSKAMELLSTVDEQLLHENLRDVDDDGLINAWKSALSFGGANSNVIEVASVGAQLRAKAANEVYSELSDKPDAYKADFLRTMQSACYVSSSIITSEEPEVKESLMQMWGDVFSDLKEPTDESLVNAARNLEEMILTNPYVVSRSTYELLGLDEQDKQELETSYEQERIIEQLEFVKGREQRLKKIEDDLRLSMELAENGIEDLLEKKTVFEYPPDEDGSRRFTYFDTHRMRRRDMFEAEDRDGNKCIYIVPSKGNGGISNRLNIAYGLISGTYTETGSIDEFYSSAEESGYRIDDSGSPIRIAGKRKLYIRDLHLRLPAAAAAEEIRTPGQTLISDEFEEALVPPRNPREAAERQEAALKEQRFTLEERLLEADMSPIGARSLTLDIVENYDSFIDDLKNERNEAVIAAHFGIHKLKLEDAIEFIHSVDYDDMEDFITELLQAGQILFVEANNDLFETDEEGSYISKERVRALARDNPRW